MKLSTRVKESTSPIVQLSIDVISVDDAVAKGQMGLRAGVDWLEAGTPLAAWVGIHGLRQFADAFPDHTTFLDVKAMDSTAIYVWAAQQLGMDMVSICAAASDASVRAAVEAGANAQVGVIADLVGITDPIARARQLLDFGLGGFYLHYGWDQLQSEKDRDPSIEQLRELRELTDLPVGIVTSTTEMAVEATRSGADILLVGHPYLEGHGAEELLSDYVHLVKAAATRS